MKIFKDSRTVLWATILMLGSLVVPSTVFANGSQARGGDTAGKFLSNPASSRFNFDDRDDDSDRRGGRRGRRDRDRDDDSDRRGRRDRDRDRDDRDDRDDDFNRGGVRRIAFNNGFREGLRAGRDDRLNGRGFDFRDHGEFQDATIGFRSEFGSVDFYRRNFREGFRQGYEDGFNGRNSGRRRGSGTTLGDVLGGVFGRRG